MDQTVTAETSSTPSGAIAPETTNTPGISTPAERMFDVVLPDGKKEKWPESRIVERAQKSIGLEKRVSDAAKYETAFNNFVSKVQDPGQLLELLNHPDLKYDEDKQEALVKSMLSSKKPRLVQAVKEWLYENEVKPSMMDPKDRKIMELEEREKDRETERQKIEREQKESEETKRVTEIKNAYRIELGNAYKESGLPVDDFLVRQVMEKARLYVRAGKQPDFANCCRLVQTDFLTQCKSVLGKGTVDNILTMLDGETAQTINKALVKALDNKEDTPSDPNAPRVKSGLRKKSANGSRIWSAESSTDLTGTLTDRYPL